MEKLGRKVKEGSGVESPSSPIKVSLLPEKSDGEKFRYSAISTKILLIQFTDRELQLSERISVDFWLIISWGMYSMLKSGRPSGKSSVKANPQATLFL